MEEFTKSVAHDRGKSIYVRPANAEEGPVTLDDFETIKVIGRGSFGRVFLVVHKKSGKTFAMKSQRKDVIIDTD